MNSLKKKHKQIASGSVPPTEEKIPEEKVVPDWKKNLLRNRNSSKSMNQKSSAPKTEETSSNPADIWKSQIKKSSSLRRSERPELTKPGEVKTEPAESSSSNQSQQPPWMKEMKEKKSFGKKEENEYHQPPPVEPVKPSASIRSKESFNNNVSSSSSFNTPSISSTLSNEQTNNYNQQPAPVARPPSLSKSTPQQPTVVASQRTSSLGHKSDKPSIQAEPTLADLASELKKLRGQVQVLSLRLDEETEKRKALETKFRSLQM